MNKCLFGNHKDLYEVCPSTLVPITVLKHIRGPKNTLTAFNRILMDSAACPPTDTSILDALRYESYSKKCPRMNLVTLSLEKLL
jgi:hypothetical protein